MNKNMVIKHKREFDYWLNGGSLLVKKPLALSKWKTKDNYDGEWNKLNELTIHESIWDIEDGEYLKLIKDDEFVEFRIALSEGKTVQVTINELTKWIDIVSEEMKDFKPYNKYRIKP